MPLNHQIMHGNFKTASLISNYDINSMLYNNNNNNINKNTQLKILANVVMKSIIGIYKSIKNKIISTHIISIHINNLSYTLMLIFKILSSTSAIQLLLCWEFSGTF